MKLYQVTTKYFVAGYVEDDSGKVVQCAPILLKKFSYWKTQSSLIGEYQMSKRYEITKIEYNQKMSSKYDGAFLHTISIEGGAKRRDFVFENSKMFKVLQECAIGDTVELKIVKNGDFFNLAKDDDAITLVAKQKDVGEKQKPAEDYAAPLLTPTGAGAYPGIASTPAKSYGGYKEDPDKQAAIIRQNALTNATNLIIASSNIGGNVDNSIKYIISTAIQFVKFTSGEDMTEYLAEEFMEEDKIKLAVALPKRIKKAKDEDKEVPSGEFGE